MNTKKLALFATLALFSAACSDTSSINSSPLFSTGGVSAAASNFAILANQAVTCTDGSIVGDVGTEQASPTGSFTQTSCPVTGSIHIGDGVAKQAYQGFLADYIALAPQAGDVCPIITGTLAGVTLSPGTYCVSAEAKTGVLTLDGSGSYLFKVATGAFTGTNFSVVLINGAESCDITWGVDAAATMTDSNLKGDILAGAAITLTRGTFYGSAYSHADVTVTGTEVVGCSSGRKGHGGQR